MGLQKQRFDPSRRGFLRRTGARQLEAVRPPWALSETLFIEQCSRCEQCVQHCPEGILRHGSGGFPEMHFDTAGCTFCGACVTACETGALSRSVSAPVPWRVAVSDECLSIRGVMCRACADECEMRAIRFRAQPGGRAEVSVVSDACSGCGACIRFCPVRAIHLKAVIKHGVAA